MKEVVKVVKVVKVSSSSGIPIIDNPLPFWNFFCYATHFMFLLENKSDLI